MQKGYRYQPPVNEISSPKKPEKRKNNAFAFAFIAIALLSYFVISRSQSAQKWVQESPKQTPRQTNVSPTPFPFQEITIPYLRAREYKSQLGERTLAYQTDTYQAYNTSYTSDGLRINGVLTVPAGTVPSQGWPAVVFVHGYIPPAQYGSQYYDYVDYLARSGFVVFKIDLRGHAQSEGRATGAYYSGDYVVDTLNARAALQTSDFVNPNKVGLWGHSMAGNITIRALVTRPDIPAVAIWGGAVFTYADRLKYGIQDSSYRPPGQTSELSRQRQRMRDLYGEFSMNSQFWQQVTPTNYLSDVKGAISLHHARDDDVVNIGYSRDFIDVLTDTSIPHQLKEYQSGGHNISGSAFITAMEDTVAFYRKYLSQ